MSEAATNVSRTKEWLLAHRDYPHKDWCLVWPFYRDRREGRGIVDATEEGESKLAHRVMCEMVNGPPPPDKPQATHSCGNGHEGCVNPNHLLWGNNSDNQHQRYEHGRANSHTQGNRSRFTAEQIEKMRSQWGEFTQERLAEIYGVTVQTIQYYLKYREAKGHAGGKVKHWSPEDDESLKEALDRGLSLAEAAEYVGRSYGATTSRVYRKGFKKSA